MLNVGLYNQAFNLAFQNYLAARAQGHAMHKLQSNRTMMALVRYMARHNHALAFDGNEFFFCPFYRMDRWRDEQ